MFGKRGAFLSMAIATAVLAVAPHAVQAQNRGGGPRVEANATVSLTVEARSTIREYYAEHRAPAAQALPPGMRNRLARGKALPPGIAKKSLPPELGARLAVPSGYEVIEVGLDVLLVEVATNVVHDVLMDIIS
jgi:hypothetical protein